VNRRTGQSGGTHFAHPRQHLHHPAAPTRVNLSRRSTKNTVGRYIAGCRPGKAEHRAKTQTGRVGPRTIVSRYFQARVVWSGSRTALHRIIRVSIPRAPSGASARPPSPSPPPHLPGRRFQSTGRLRGQVQGRQQPRHRRGERRWFQSPGRLRGQVQGRSRGRPRSPSPSRFNPPGAFGGKCKTGPSPRNNQKSVWSFNPPGAFGGKCKSCIKHLKALAPGFSMFQSPGRLRGQVQASC
jgi:hypothetical protein